MDDTIYRSGTRVTALGNLDYVKDGVLYRNAPIVSVLVESSEDLEDLVSEYSVGTIAYTAGWAKMWQLDADKEWQEVI